MARNCINLLGNLSFTNIIKLVIVVVVVEQMFFYINVPSSDIGTSIGIGECP